MLEVRAANLLMRGVNAAASRLLWRRHQHPVNAIQQYLWDQIQGLKQGNRAISDYIKYAENLSGLTNNPTLQQGLARAFVIGIADSINQRIVTSQLPKNGYTFDEAREVVERVYSYPSSSSNQDRIVDYPVFATNPTLDPTAALIQILETMCNKMAEWSPRPMNQQQPSFQQSLQSSNTL
ncbi:MAG: hypothetical protein M1839_002579 [Geoglossum umbratile]|nr:MAG: hypothetical protein M1839_002579 [Geoglossum umbratile]